MDNKNQLIVIEQLPIIKTYLENLSIEIKEKVDNAMSLVCTEENYKEIKKVRSELNKEFQELESQRKTVKNAVMEKYNDFEKVYKENVGNLYELADAELKKKIDDTTNALVKEKEEQIRDFANEHIVFNNLQDIIKFEDIGLNVNLSCSMKSLETQTLEFIKKISDDLECISSQENREELLYEYQKNGFEYSKAVLTITKKNEQLKALKEREERLQKQREEEQKHDEKVEELIVEHEEMLMPQEVEPIEKWQFTILATQSQVIELKKWFEERGIERI